MGGHSGLKASLRTKIPTAFHAHDAPLVTELLQRLHYVQDDFLGRFRAIPTLTKIKPKKPILYGLSTLFDRFWEPVQNVLYNRPACCFYVMLCDDKTNQPREKEDEHKKRREAEEKAHQKDGVEKPIPYPPDARFERNGILVHGEVEKIDILRLRASPHLSLWRAFYPFIVKALSAPTTRYFHFLFSHDKAGATLFVNERNRSGGPRQKEGGGEGVQVTEGLWPHNLGEGEVSMITWAARLRPLNLACLLHTADTDILPLWFINASTFGLRDVFWYDTYLSSMCDLTHLSAGLPDVYGVSEKRFALFCILAENDFMQREHYGFDFGLDAVLAATRKITPLTGDGDFSCADARQLFREFLFHLYYNEWTIAGKGVPPDAVYAHDEHFDKLCKVLRGIKLSGRKRFPTEAMVEKYTRRLYFNVIYWATAGRPEGPSTTHAWSEPT